MKRAVISGKYPKFITALKQLDYEIIKVEPYKDNFDNSEASHADMQILNLDNKAIILLRNNNCFNKKIIDFCQDTSTEIIFTDTDIYKFIYPECVKLNIALVGHYAIGNFKYTDNAVISILEKYHYERINVKQGYAKCSTSIVSDGAIITSDTSIFRAVQGKIDCLKISEGYISLCEKYGGFIGGASFLLDKSTLAFTGDITAHPDYINIKSFCRNHGVDVLSLSKSPLCDVGGAVII